MSENDELIEILESRFECCDVSQLIEFFVESGLVSEKSIKYYLIKDQYYKRLDGVTSCTDIKLDLAAEYDTSFPTVKRIIYEYKHLLP